MKIQRQPGPSIKAAEMAGASAEAPNAPTMKRLTAFGRSAAPNNTSTSVRALVKKAPPPKPCTKRAAASQEKSLQAAQASEPARNSASAADR